MLDTVHFSLLRGSKQFGGMESSGKKRVHKSYTKRGLGGVIRVGVKVILPLIKVRSAVKQSLVAQSGVTFLSSDGVLKRFPP